LAVEIDTGFGFLALPGQPAGPFPPCTRIPPMWLRTSVLRGRAILALAVATAVPIFALDLLTRHGIGTWLLYLIPLLLASKVGGARAIFPLAAGFSVLIGIGFLAGLPYDPLATSLVNCSLAIVVLWIAALLLKQQTRAEQRAEEERGRLLQDIAVEKARWQATVDNMLDPVCTCDAAGVATYMNAAYTRLVQLTIREDLDLGEHASHYQLYRGDGTLFDPRDLPLQRAALSGEDVRDVEVVQRTGEGRERVIIWNAAPLRNAAGDLTGAVAVGRDVTALREAQRALQRSEQAYRTLAENAPDIIERFNRQGEYIYVNRLGLDLRGKLAEAVLGKGIAEIGVPEPYASRWRERIRCVFRTGEPTEAEDGLLTRDGIRIFHSRFAPERAADGSVESVLVFSHDITERRLAEEALCGARDALEKQLEERTAALTRVGERLQVDAPSTEAAGDAIRELSELLNRRVGELAALDKITRALASSLDPGLVLRLLVAEVQGLLGTEGASVLLYDADRAELTFAASEGLGAEGLMGERVPAQASLAGWVLREQRAALVNDVRGHPLVADPPRVLLDGEVRSILAVPLVSRGTGIGVLGAINKIGGAFTDSDLQSLAAVAGAAAVAIENARLYGMEQARRTQLEAVRTVATEITRELHLPTLLRLIAQRAGELLGDAAGTVWLWDEEAQALAPGATLGQEWWTGERRLRLGEGVAGTVAQRREGLLVNDYRDSPFAHPIVRARSRITAVVAEPLLYHDRLVGVIALDNGHTGRTFRPEDQELLGLFAAHAAIAIGNAALYRQVRLQRDRLRALTDQTLRNREEEAKRIARELHDEIGQSLTCILLAMQGIEGLESLEEIRQKAAEVRALAAKPLGDIQRLIRALRPVILDDLGLVAALERHVKGFAAATGLHAEFYARGLEGLRLPSSLETSLYRILQEGLTNVAKHARARHVSVILQRRGAAVSLIVEDDGQGFDVAAAKGRAGGGVGLLGMEERAFLLGGTVRIESAPGAGTTIVVEVPLQTPEGTNGQD
jgi:PAS domain S-box-containing protein